MVRVPQGDIYIDRLVRMSQMCYYYTKSLNLAAKNVYLQSKPTPMLVLSTGSLYRYGLNRIFEFTKEAGYDAIEIVLNDIYDTRDGNYIKGLMKDYDLPVAAITMPVNNSPNKVHFAVELAEQLESDVVTLRPPLFTDFKFTQWFKNNLPKMQNETKTQIAVENVPAGRGFFLPQFSLRNIEDLKRFTHTSLDTSHLVTQKLHLLKVYEMIKRRLSYVHLSNWHKGDEHHMLDEGLLPLESFLTHLKRDGYDGPISIKLNLRAMGAGDNDAVRRNLQKCKKFYERYYVETQDISKESKVSEKEKKEKEKEKEEVEA